MRAVGQVVSVNVGQPQPRQRRLGDGATVRNYVTAIHKPPVAEPVAVRMLGLAGDAQGDTVNTWRRRQGGPHPVPRQPPVALGAGWPTGPARGDRREPDAGRSCGGGALLQVTQPRIPCYKQAEQTGAADVVERIVASGRTGLHLRVLAAGAVQAGDVVSLVRRSHPDWPVLRLHRLVHTHGTSEERAAAAAIPELSAELRRRFAQALEPRPDVGRRE